MRRVLATPRRNFSETERLGQSGKQLGKEKGGAKKAPP
jgi:hypothetical protein